jgi:type I site-specific restriction endonuclease
VNKKDLSERDICTKFITPAVKASGWEVLSQIQEQIFGALSGSGEFLKEVLQA